MPSSPELVPCPALWAPGREEALGVRQGRAGSPGPVLPQMVAWVFSRSVSLGYEQVLQVGAIPPRTMAGRRPKELTTLTHPIQWFWASWGYNPASRCLPELVSAGKGAAEPANRHLMARPTSGPANAALPTVAVGTLARWLRVPGGVQAPPTRR